LKGLRKTKERMAQEELRDKLSWLLVLTNLIAGVVWVFAAFGVVKGKEGINLLYLAIGIVCLVASGAWFLSLRAS